jgi:hypothetical protein
VTPAEALAQRARALGSTGLPDPAGLDERRQAFWALAVAAEHLDTPALTPWDVCTILRDACGIDLPRQRIEGILSKEKGTVAKRKLKGRKAYQLMASGRAELATGDNGGGAMFIDPAKGFSGLRAAHGLLAGLEGQVSVCDPYADAQTLDVLAECTAADSVRLLTSNVKKPDGLRQTAKVFAREHGMPLEVRRASEKVLHDRYAIHRDGMLMFGTSLNGLGLKQSFVVELGKGLRSTVLPTYEAAWGAATPL